MAINDNGTITHTGLVLSTYERNGINDSDFVAIVWNPDTHAIDHITYDSTSYGGYGKATVDATPDVIAEAEKALAARIAETDLAQARKDATTPVKGRLVRSTTTRGKNVGAEGIVMWRGEKRSRYGTWSYGYRVGIKVSGESRLRYLDETSVEVIEPPAVDESAIIQRAAQAARRHQWAMPR
jgi:hypothetical protein